MVSATADTDSLTKTPPRLCYHALPTMKPEPLGMKTPPLQAPGAVPFIWEVVPGKPRVTHGGEAAIARRLEPPPRMAFLPSSASAWQGTKVADADVASAAASGGPYYELLRPSPSLFDGPSVVARSSSLSRFSFRNYADGKEGQRKRERSTWWFWGWSARTRDDRSLGMKKGVASTAYLRRSRSTASKCYNGDSEEVKVGTAEDAAPATAANVKITRFRMKGSVSDISAASSNLWASIYGVFKHAVSAPWRSLKSTSKR